MGDAAIPEFRAGGQPDAAGPGIVGYTHHWRQELGLGPVCLVAASVLACLLWSRDMLPGLTALV